MSTFGYNKMSQNAIAAMSYLAGQYADESACATSAQIAKARDLSQTLVAKILTLLSQAGYVTGSPGPSTTAAAWVQQPEGSGALLRDWRG